MTVGGSAATPNIGTAPATLLWAVPYDIDDNNQIDFGDFSFFAPAFGLPVGDSEPPLTWWADFDKSGVVDFGDFSFFAPNFGKSRPDATITFPPNYPDSGPLGDRDAASVVPVVGPAPPIRSSRPVSSPRIATRIVDGGANYAAASKAVGETGLGDSLATF